MREEEMDLSTNLHYSRKIKVSSETNLEFNDTVTEQLEYATAGGVSTYAIMFTPMGQNSFPKKPIILKEDLTKAVTEPRNIISCMHTRNGKLLIKTANLNTAIEISKLTKIMEVQTQSSILTENITSKFLLQEIPLDHALTELAAELSYNDITVHSIRRFTRRGSSTLSETCLITIYGISIPTEVKFWYNLVKPTPFYDRPRQCTKCFKFNHATKNCSAKHQSCSYCSGTHAFSECASTEPTCINCAGNHPVDFPTCPSRLEEAKFLEFKSKNHLSFSEARRQFKPIQHTSTYASISKSEQVTTVENIKSIVKSVVSEVVTTFDSKLQALSQRQDVLFEKLFTVIDKLTSRLDNSIEPHSSRKKFRSLEQNNQASLLTSLEPVPIPPAKPTKDQVSQNRESSLIPTLEQSQQSISSPASSQTSTDTTTKSSLKNTPQARSNTSISDTVKLDKRHTRNLKR
ncbi:uncharacterized protein [Parasteatoda tepidariorum]|uniref:uncharacterized protein n=1 Tax=Parasteatoda tepidariorum TaxID=114398 RepID=UPI0039BD1B0D